MPDKYELSLSLSQAVIRVRFPDNITLEAKFHPTETIQSLVDLLMKVVARPELPFYICKNITWWRSYYFTYRECFYLVI